ncbi:MAG: TlpA disulfide reductase family protein [Deltaproteobacteria bacterium]|jgi:thiol-disulfide isomerase/thioredoxin
MPKKIARNAWLMLISAFLIYSAGCEKEVEAGPAAPDFSLPAISGDTVTLGAYEGFVVLLDFWATWCPPCRMSIPELVKLQKEYKDDGFIVLGISMDDPSRISDQDLESFKKMARINYPILRYNKKIVGDYFQDGRVSLPTMFIIDREGKIRKRIVGFDHAALKRSLADLIE